ncbi:MAG TPA: hypothetical protein VIK45_04980 [Candidatus Dormibacteraeota bacterium]
MAIIYGAGLAMALLSGGAIGLFLTAAHYERIASQRQEYEREMTESRDFYAVLAMFRHIKPVNPTDDKAA